MLTGFDVMNGRQMSTAAVFLYDSFPARRFGGNVAGIVLLERPASPVWMQHVAAELGAPTTGFVDLASARSGAARVRFFTPVREIDACGHVTVAIATLLVELGVWPSGEAMVEAAGGRFPLVTRRDDEGRIDVELQQRLLHLRRVEEAEDLAGISPILGPAAVDNQLPVMVAGTGLRHLLIPVASADELGRLPLGAADIAAVSGAFDVDTIGVFTVLARDRRGVQVQLRDLCAGIGATEEPASGTTTAALAFALAHAGWLTADRPLLAMRMGIEMGRPSRLAVELDFHQGQPVLARLRGQSWRVLAGDIDPETEAPPERATEHNQEAAMRHRAR
jgi:PhzF family phenazine biosynthesis protein